MRRLIPITYLLIGGLIGFGLSRRNSLPNDPTEAKPSQTNSYDSASPETSPPRLDLDRVLVEISARMKRGYFHADRNWNEMLESISAKDMPTVVAKVHSSDSRGRFNFLEALYQRWGLIDPTAALRSAQNASFDNDARRNSAIYVVLQSWAYTNVREMAAWTLQLDHSQLRGSAVRAMSDFPDELALETVIQIAREQANQGNNHTFFNLWAEHDPATAAAEATNTLEVGSDRDWILRNVVQTWAHQDPAGALNWFVSLEQSSQATLASDLFGTISGINPAFAASALDRIPVGIIRNSATIRTINSWVTIDRAAALDWLLQQPLTVNSTQLFSTIGSYFGQGGLELANQTAERMPNSKIRKLFLKSAYRGFAKDDPIAAWEVVRQLEMGEFKDTLIREIVTNIGKANPRSALQMLSQVTDVNGTVFLTSSLIERVAEKDLAEAVDLVKLLPHVESRDHALLRLISKNGHRDFEMSAILASALSPGPATTVALVEFAENYATVEPVAAIIWLNSLPQNSAKSATTAAIISRIYLHDSARATALALGLPTGADREYAIAIVADLAGNIDTSKAVEWAKSLKGIDRTAALSGVAMGWLSQGEEQATEFLSNLTAEDLDSQFLNKVAAAQLAKSPGYGTQIVDSLPTSELRSGALTTMVKQWLQNGSFQQFAWDPHPLRKWQLSDPGQPTEWIENTDLPPEVKRDLSHIAAGGTLPITKLW